MPLCEGPFTHEAPGVRLLLPMHRCPYCHPRTACFVFRALRTRAALRWFFPCHTVASHGPSCHDGIFQLASRHRRQRCKAAFRSGHQREGPAGLIEQCGSGLSLRSQFCFNGEPLRTAPEDRQPPTDANRLLLPNANCQPPSTTNHHKPTANCRQPPTIVQYCFCGFVSCPCLDHEAESVPVNVRFCWRTLFGLYFPQGQPWCGYAARPKRRPSLLQFVVAFPLRTLPAVQSAAHASSLEKQQGLVRTPSPSQRR